jgi:ABC-type Zn uptake system ZnuABC Zn-binding protein ZnuA
MAKANIKTLNELHGVIAKYYIEKVEGGIGEDGEELSSGTLAAINTFLKNNDITVDIVEDSPTQNLSNKLQLLVMDKYKEEEVG